MAPSTIPQPFKVPVLDDLTIGRVIKPTANGSNWATMTGSGWSLPAGNYTAKQVVEGCAPLLETVLRHLGSDPLNGPTARQMLLDNLSSNLDLGTRESSFHIPTTDAGREEIAHQAIIIGKKLIEYAAETRDAHFDTKYAIRSPCEGHLLKPPVAELMFGPRSQGHLMQVYNEYLHQMVLLRDSLLPFENFEEVVIPIPGKKGRSLGMRYTEQNRSLFLAELMTKSLTQNSIFKAAISLLAPELASIEGYGCQYSQGLILPSFVVGSDSRRLFRYLPVKLDDTSTSLVFRNEHQDYYTAPRSEITMATSTLKPGSSDVAMLSFPTEAVAATWISVDEDLTAMEDSSRVVKLHVRLSDNKEAIVDLGQISRGRRYAYSAVGVDEASTESGLTVPAHVHSAADVLVRADFGLVTAKDGGIHLVPAHSNVILLALLGTLYPENVIVVPSGASLADAERAGKALPNSPKFVIQLCHVTKTCMPKGY